MHIMGYCIHTKQYNIFIELWGVLRDIYRGLSWQLTDTAVHMSRVDVIIDTK